MKCPGRCSLLYSFLLLLALSSCHKKNADTSFEISDERSQLNSSFSDLRAPSQKFTVRAGIVQTIYGEQGTKISFYPKSFKDHTGNILTGVVNIELIEMYRPGAMIANRAGTTVDGKLLASGGQVYIKATMGGQEIFANKYGIRFRQASASNKPMALFYGNTNNPDSLVTWQIGAAGTGTTSGATDSVIDSAVVVIITNTGLDTITVAHTPANYYQFDSCVNFNWVNCDYFYGATAKPAEIAVVLGNNGFNQSNTEVFVVLHDINSVTHLGKFSAATATFSLYSGYYLPSGMTIDVIAIAKKSGQYYYYEQKDLQSVDGLLINANMQPQTLDYIHSQLSGL